jgi:peroxiredoxin family protein
MSAFSVVLYNDSRDAFHEAVSFLGAARARGDAASLFLRGPALRAFVTGVWKAPEDPALGKALEDFGPVTPEDMLAELRAKGKTPVTACSAWVRILKLPAEQVAAKVDAVTGLNAFLSQAAGGPILYI